ncbi:MAG: FAD binding domain-containing protein [Alphaproteobacteria bacterium]|nr:FAD binding domain-containing protein [Alphaproteobacteria bacterium]
MKPAPFRFTAPGARAELLQTLAEHGDAARVLAGGQSLVPLMNMRMVQPALLVSINLCRELDYIRVEDGALVIGALTRQSTAEQSPLVHRHCPLLAAALPWVGGMANRNRGTVCGSLAHADPLAELPAVALALEAQMVVSRAGATRHVSARDFFVDALTSCLQPGEMLEAVRFPAARPGDRVAFLEIANRSHAFAVAGAALRVTLDADGRCSALGIAVIGGGSTARRLAGAERALQGRALDRAAIDDAVATVGAEVDPIADIHADAGYRRHALGVLVGRALRNAAGASA